MKKNWIVKQDSFVAEEALAWEGLFTQGSGALHLRGSMEESFRDSPQNVEYIRKLQNVSAETFLSQNTKWGSYLPAIYSTHPEFTMQLTNLPSPLGIDLYVAGEKLDLIDSNITDFCRTLDLQTALLERKMTWTCADGTVLSLRYRRFVSAVRKHLVVQQLALLSETEMDIEIRASIDADVRTNGHDHFTKTLCFGSENRAGCEVQTDGGVTIQALCQMVESGWELKTYPRKSELRKTIKLRPGIETVVEKRSVLSNEIGQCETILDDVSSLTFDELFSAHTAQWKQRWEKCDVEIDGDDDSQLALRVGIYHLLRSHPGGDHAAIGAKGFAGEAYFGHFFWDTEIFMMPFFLYTDPEKAKQLMDFRIRTLPGAKANAIEYGYTGARFAWQSDLNGLESCSKGLWQYRDHEIHVPADVVYGFLHYAKATGQEEYIDRDAAETIIEIARYWMQRIDWRNGKPVLLAVMGPDEYQPLFNNNAFTNRLVKCALQAAVRVADANEITQPERDSWKQVADELPILQREDGLILQHEIFDDLAEPDFQNDWPDRSKPYAATVHQEKNYRTKSTKQPDVIQMMLLFPQEFSQEQMLQAWDYYTPYCTHDSSLSPGIHAMMAAKIGLEEEAWDFWTQTYGLDLNVKKGKAAQGIHIACAATLWQCVIFGFAKVCFAMETDTLTLDPQLPDAWKRISFPLVWKGQSVKITITSRSTIVENQSESPIEVNVYGESRIVNDREEFTQKS